MILLWTGFLILLFTSQTYLCAGAVTTAQKTLLLSMHNDARQQLLDCKMIGQPVPATMPMLVWNDALAAKAQTWSDQCTVGHDTSSARAVGSWTWVGQNFAGTGILNQAVPMWVEENKNYNYDTNTCNATACGHYTQVVWAASTDIGCGVTDCKSNPSYAYGLSIVCNYGPGGNYAGQKPYTKGNQSVCLVSKNSTAAILSAAAPAVTSVAFTMMVH
ncbi:unnamed protein product [Echinostoma caproni]|uniref:SCP domain-containing protein n=1 Tax=Echinostoma caproni TaxID=27848 RepID=A0A183AGZ7_9TREM|nr:unnamed protein product [Echinostoma caproni]